MRLHGAMLFVKDLGLMTAFYTDVLGLTPNEATRIDTWVEFTDAGFSLHAIPVGIAEGIQIQSPPHPREQSVAKLTFEVQDVDATLTKIQSMGLPLLRRPWGGTEAVDPEGNVFALCAAT
jgi:predicted enzyme related to lactoylglutathione lyase